MNRVVITGIGALCPLGETFDEAWDALIRGASGVVPFHEFQNLKWKYAGTVHDDAIRSWVTAKEVKRLDRFILLAHTASKMAADDAKVDASALQKAGIIMGSSRGGIGMLEDAVRSRTTAYLMAGTTISMAASYPAISLGIGGHASGVSNACASGATAIGEAFQRIRFGKSSIMFAGGAEAPLTKLCAEGYGRAGALSISGVSRPFDRNRDGFVLSEGAAVLVLEEYHHAVGRGARIYAELTGYGSSCDASHPTEPSWEGQKRAISAALDDAGLSPQEIGMVCAHATSTPIGDKAEATSIEVAFGKRGVKVFAPKSMTGHMLGASGAFEAAISAMSIHTGNIPPTINLSDCEFELDCPSSMTALSEGSVVSNSFGFGGVNAVLVFSAYEGK